MVAFNPVDLAIVSLSVPQLRPICARHACTVKVTLSNVKATTVFVVLPCPKLGMVSSRMQCPSFLKGRDTRETLCTLMRMAWR